MNITSKYDVSDLIQHKYEQTLTNDITAYEVLDIRTETCYAGTQISYICRPLIGRTDHNLSDEMNKLIKSLTSGRTTESEYVRFREDEVKPCTPELVALIKGEKKQGEN